MVSNAGVSVKVLVMVLNQQTSEKKSLETQHNVVISAAKYADFAIIWHVSVTVLPNVNGGFLKGWYPKMDCL